MSRQCLLESSHACNPDAQGRCVCTPAGENAYEWARMSPRERGDLLRGRDLMGIAASSK